MSLLAKLLSQQLGQKIYRSYENIVCQFRCNANLEKNTCFWSEWSEGPTFAAEYSTVRGWEEYVALSNEEGQLALLNVESGKYCIIMAHNNAVFDLSWMGSEKRIVTASGDHTAKLFDVGVQEIRMVSQFAGHSRSVKTVVSMIDNPDVFASGGRDGNIFVWDTRCNGVSLSVGRLDHRVCNAHVTLKPARRKGLSIPAKSVTGLVFQNDNTLISCGAGDGPIKVWDLRRSYHQMLNKPWPKYIIPYNGVSYKNGYSNLRFDERRQILYANCLDNSIYAYNMGTYNTKPIMNYRGHHNNTFYIRSDLSMDGSYLISGSSDDYAYIWHIDNEVPLLRLAGHSAEVTCVAWSKTHCPTLFTCADDYTQRIWRVLPNNQHENETGSSGLNANAGTVETCKVFTISKPDKRIADANEDMRLIREHVKSMLNEPSGIEYPKETIKCSNHVDLERELSNLPNYVLDGTAPHLVWSPPQRRRLKLDWLTDLKRRRQLNKEQSPKMQDPTNATSMVANGNNNDKKVLSKRTDITGTPTSSPNRHKRKSGTPAGLLGSPLLKFFKMTNNCNTNGKITTHNTSVKNSCNSGIQGGSDIYNSKSTASHGNFDG